MPTTRVPAVYGPIRAWIFDWDGIFVDSEKWKAWTYGLGLSYVYPDFASLAASRFNPQQPQSGDPFLQACGRYVGKSREEYARGVVADYDALGYQLSARLSEVAAEWMKAAPDRMEQVKRERIKTGILLDTSVDPWEVLFELRRPYYERYQDNVEPISDNVQFLITLPENIPAGLVTRTPEDRVRSLMERFAIPVGRFRKLTCVPQKDVWKARMYEETANSLGIALDQCAAVEDTETGVTDAQRAGVEHRQQMGLVIACPTAMTIVQEFGAADLVVHGSLLTLRALADSLGHGSLDG